WKDVAGTRTYFFYSAEGLIAEYDVSGTELRSYGYKPDSTWSTDPLWLQTGGQYSFYHNDHLGTPQKLTAQNGMVAWSAQYSAFGGATVDTEFITNNLRFPGQYYDAETGLHYNFQRYYDPGIGRYVSVNPIGFASEEANWYGYAHNNPSRYKDAAGLQSDCGQDDLWCCPDDPYTGCCGPDVTDSVNKTLENIRAIYESWGVFDSRMDSTDQNRSKQWSACSTIIGMGDKTPFDLAAIPEWKFRVLDQFNPIGYFDAMSDTTTPLTGWDIRPLFDIGNADRETGEGTLPTHLWPDIQDSIKNGDGVSDSGGKEHDCRWTVTYAGGCFNAGYLNYLMWGKMNSMCQNTFRDHPKNFLWELKTSLELAKAAKYARQNYIAITEIFPIISAGYNGGNPQSTLHSKCKVDSRSGIVPPAIFPTERWYWEPIKSSWGQ
ncbi:MAG: hypothetical protein GY790_03240, partial [Bacteroidetes bacterium]|nr:hypothetical protein [Bacteroidota bacterium]